MKATNVISLLMALIAVTLAIETGGANAIPIYSAAVQQTYGESGACVTCHVTANGEGLNLYGLRFNEIPYHANEPGRALAAIGRPLPQAIYQPRQQTYQPTRPIYNNDNNNVNNFGSSHNSENKTNGGASCWSTSRNFGRCLGKGIRGFFGGFIDGAGNG